MLININYLNGAIGFGIGIFIGWLLTYKYQEKQKEDEKKET